MVDWCSYKAALFACQNWHYSGKIPMGKLAKLGIWEDEDFIGCVIFGPSVTTTLGTAYGLLWHQCCELARVALKVHGNPVTRIVSISIRVLKQCNPRLRLIVSYADPFVGHLGVIYQAGNWIYVGETGGGCQYFFRGSWRNDRPLSTYFRDNPGERKRLVKRLIPGKHKYLYPLDKAMRRQIEPLRQPYPKRATEGSDPTPMG